MMGSAMGVGAHTHSSSTVSFLFPSDSVLVTEVTMEPHHIINMSPTVLIWLGTSLKIILNLIIIHFKPDP